MTSTPPPLLDLGFLRDRGAQRRIAAIALGCAVLGGLYGWLGPKWYRATAAITPVGPQRGGGLASMLGGELGALAALGAPGGGADPAKVTAVLQSNAVADAAIGRLDLLARYGAATREEARERLWRRCDVTTWAKPGLVSLGCEDREPAFAARLVTTMVEEGNQVFRKASSSSASEEVRFMERRVADLRNQARESAARMREFQERHGIVDIDAQSRALVSAYAALRGQRAVKQLELDYLRSFASPDESSTRQAERQLEMLDRSLEDFQEERPLQASGGRRGKDMLPVAKDVPALRAEFEGLYRDRRVAETSLVFALERLESAKASEARDVSTFVVLDPATVPTRPHRPRPAPVAALAGVTGLALAVAFEWWRARSRRRG